MNSRVLPLLCCLVVVAGAAAFVLWTASQRTARLRALTELGSSAQPETGSRTGYARGIRNQIIPETQFASHQWLVQAEETAATGAWRLRQVGYDNAPGGRETQLASPFRWWLEAVAALSGGRPMEAAALRAGPALQLVFLIAAAAFTAWRFGALAGGLVAAGWVLLFPLAGAFLPGHPDDVGLKSGLGFASVLLVLAGTLGPDAHARRLFIAGGIAGATGLWLNAMAQFPVLAGLVVAGFVAASRFPGATALPWRAWGVSGATASVAFWLFEFAPAHLGGWRLESNHPLLALAWWGAAELLAQFAAWRRTGRRPAGVWHWGGTVAAAGAFLALPIAIKLTAARVSASLATHPEQLTAGRGGISAESLAAWIGRDGFSAATWATLAPLAVVVTAIAMVVRARIDPARCVALLLGTGPAVALAVLACNHLHGWNLFAGAALALGAVAAGSAGTLAGRAGWVLGAALVLGPSLGLLRPPPASLEAEVLAPEVDALVARDLAHWLAARSPEAGAVVLAPPSLSAGLIYYGGLRALSTPWWENQDGFGAAARIMGAASTDEALALAQRRQVTHLVLPSWDPSLETAARLSGAEFDKTLAGLLRQWLPPRWLRPLPYQLPGIAGLEGRSVHVFEVVEAQDNPTALGRLAEYFLETGQPQLARAVAASLEQAFPHELSALAARAHVDLAHRDGAAVTATLAAIDAQLAQGADEILPWERRISLALALAQARRLEQARAMIANCLEGADDERLRSLTAGTLYRLLLFCRTTGVEFADPAQRTAALALLPAEWRDRLK